MLAKKERLSREAFSRFFVAGKRHHTTLFQIIYTPHPTFHASVVVSKKIAKTAVLRNKLRRRIYDIVRRQRVATGMTGVYIFITKPEVVKTTFTELKAQVEAALTKISPK